MKKFRITDQNKKKVGLAITIAIVVFLVLVCIVVGIPLLKFAKDPERFSTSPFRLLKGEVFYCRSLEAVSRYA